MAERPVAFVDGTVFTANPDRPWAEAFVVRDGRFEAVGDDDGARAAAGPGAEVHDLEGRLVVPGFVDGHFHLLDTGDSLLRVDLVRARDLGSIQRLVRDHAEAHPDAGWVLGKGWLFDAVPDRRPTAAMLDAVVADRPVLLDANDYHSSWVNSAALRQLAIDESTPDPAGGRIDRDEAGHATGFLEETAAEMIAWGHLDRIATPGERLARLRAAVRALSTVGVTTVIDMGLGPSALEAMATAEREGWLDVRVIGHWLVTRDGGPADHLARVDDAARLARTHRSDRLRIAGIKIVVDGVIDGCTAFIDEPYTTGALPPPIWDLDALVPVVRAADRAGLQVALHAIGDAAVRSALDAIETAVRTNGGKRERRHRVEHIETVHRADVERFARLGVTASMQPVHADPAIAPNWRAMIGPRRAARAFPVGELVAAGVRLVFGTDAPTAPFAPLPNLYVATTRRSTFDQTLPPRLPESAVPLADAIVHATADAAWSFFAEDRLGTIEDGRLADFVVVEPNVIDADPDALLDAKVVATYVEGTQIHGV
jgi:predicted amidohydrolase YtcJ